MQPPNPQRPRPAGQQPDNNNGQQPDQRRRLLRRLLLWLPLLLIIVGPLVFQFLQGDGQQTRIIYSEFRRQVEAENVESVTVSGQEATGTLREPAQTEDTDGETTEYTEFATTLPEGSTEELFEQLNAQNVNIEVVPQNDFNFLNLLVNLLPFLLIFGLLFFLFRRSQAQGQQIFQIGQSKAKLYDRTSEATTFEDVAGQAGAKRELEEVVDFLSEPERFERLGGEIPRGVLLVGPPGTGKTLLARAVAGEAGVPVFSITGADFMEMFVGVGAARVRDLFGEAKKVAPSIIFIDELDSIGRRRGAGLGGGHDEREQTLNQILSELDGFEESRNVIVIAATNRPDILDPALLRPGRFDRQITVDLPTKQDRTAILKIHARGKPLAPDLDLERVAAGTPGFSGADLQNLLNEAALLAARKDKDAIDQTDIEEARDKII
ncbi:MAG: ATP-dependent zinc metalloprotease FtsH, partial [Chloroflexi bacterium]|nr:ATP-dependent zinc metalloprotease FtsH [Chloroflexota bacterium]